MTIVHFASGRTSTKLTRSELADWNFGRGFVGFRHGESGFDLDFLVENVSVAEKEIVRGGLNVQVDSLEVG